VVRAAHGAPTVLPQALTDGFSRAFAVGAGFAVVGIVLALLFVSNRDRPLPPELEPSGDPSPGSARESLARA